MKICVYFKIHVSGLAVLLDLGHLRFSKQQIQRQGGQGQV